MYTDVWLFCQIVTLAKNGMAPPQECVGDDISFTILASKHDTDLVTMHWAPDCLWHSSRRNGLWTPTLLHSIHSCYMCVRDRTQPLDVQQAPKNSHCQNAACGMYLSIQSYARSHMVSKHLQDHPNPLPSHSQAIISLLTQVQVHGTDTSFSTHPLYAGSHYPI